MFQEMAIKCDKTGKTYTFSQATDKIHDKDVMVISLAELSMAAHSLTDELMGSNNELKKYVFEINEPFLGRVTVVYEWEPSDGFKLEINPDEDDEENYPGDYIEKNRLYVIN